MLQITANALDVKLPRKSTVLSLGKKDAFLNQLRLVYAAILNLGTSGIENQHLLKHIRSTNLLSLTTFAGSLFYLLMAVFFNSFYWMNASLALAFTAVLTLGLNAMDKTTLSRIVYTIGLNVFIFLSALLSGSEAHLQGFLLLAAITPFLIFDLDQKMTVALGVLLPIALIYTFDFAAPHFTVFNLPEPEQLMVSKAALALQLALLLLGIYYLIRNKRRSEDENEFSKNIIAQQANLLKRYQVESEQLAYVISHDLRAPVRNISSFMNLLAVKHAPALNPEAREFIEYTRTGSKRMERLIEDLVIYCRLGTNLPPEAPVDMNKMLTRMQFELSPKLSAAKGTISITDTLPVIKSAHAVLLQQLMQHLILNGLKFNKSEKPEINVSGSETNEFYTFAVKDNGIGISKEYATAIYLIFKRLHGETEYDGIGSGLAICKKIVELYQGQIWFESQLGQGTTFHFTIRK